jgi:hypothetical protein
MKSIIILLMFFLSIILALMLINMASPVSQDSILFSLINPKGSYSYITLAIMTFILGTISLLIVESVNHKQKKYQLLDMFINDIRETWSELDSLKLMPTGDKLCSARYYFMGISGITYLGIPEINFEVHNLNFYETKGYELASMLKPKARKIFWHVYQIIRKAESVRVHLKNNKPESQDYESYQKLFIELLNKLSNEILSLENELLKERSLLFKLSKSA